MKSFNFAIFICLDGQATEAIEFYQHVFKGELLFKITNQEFKERMNPELIIPRGTENYISHSIIQIGEMQLQVADNPLFEGMDFKAGTKTSFSISTTDVSEAKIMYQEIIKHKETMVLVEPHENEFADFYTILKDPYGMIIQIANERISDPSKKGEKM